MDTKICSKCGKELPLDMFHKHPHTKDGRASYCKTCLNEYNRQRKAAKSKASKPIETPSGGAEHIHKVYTHKDLARFTPRELMLELKARGYEGELLFREVKVTEHRINLSKIE